MSAPLIERHSQAPILKWFFVLGSSLCGSRSFPQSAIENSKVSTGINFLSAMSRKLTFYSARLRSAIVPGCVKTLNQNYRWRIPASLPSRWHKCGMFYLLLVRFTRQSVTLSQSTKILLSFHTGWTQSGHSEFLTISTHLYQLYTEILLFQVLGRFDLIP